MNIDDGDEYCTCDIGPFSTCPVCEKANARRAQEAYEQLKNKPPERPKRRSITVAEVALHYDRLKRPKL